MCNDLCFRRVFFQFATIFACFVSLKTPTFALPFDKSLLSPQDYVERKICWSRCDEDTVDLPTMVFFTSHVTNLDGLTCVVFHPKLLYTPRFSGNQLIAGISKSFFFLFPIYDSLFVFRGSYFDVSLTFRICHLNKSITFKSRFNSKTNGFLKTKEL